jgi:hypothetical protein
MNRKARLEWWDLIDWNKVFRFEVGLCFILAWWVFIVWALKGGSL